MIHWKLTEQQADQVLVALQHRPYLEVAGLIGVLMQQAQEQQKAQQAQLQAQLPKTAERWPEDVALVAAEPAAPRVSNGLDTF